VPDRDLLSAVACKRSCKNSSAWASTTTRPCSRHSAHASSCIGSTSRSGSPDSAHLGVYPIASAPLGSLLEFVRS